MAGIIESLSGGLAGAVIALIGNFLIFRKTQKKELLATENATMRIDARRIARDKTMEVMVAADKLFDETRYIHNDAGKSATDYLQVNFKELFWKNQIYLPSEVIPLIIDMMRATLRMLSDYQYDRPKYHEDSVQISAVYQALINKVRSIFFFDTKDLSAQVNHEMATMFDKQEDNPKIEAP